MFTERIALFDTFVYKIKKIVVILSATAYNELEVANLQTAVDTCQCLYNKITKYASKVTSLISPRFFTLYHWFS